MVFSRLSSFAAKRYLDPLRGKGRISSRHKDGLSSRLAFATSVGVVLWWDIGSLQESTAALTSYGYTQKNPRGRLRSLSSLTLCESSIIEDTEEDFPSGYTESDRFFDCLDYHHSLLPDYIRRWGNLEEQDTHADPWPDKTPAASEIPALELDLRFCQKNQNVDARNCQDQEFLIASFHLTKKDDSKSQQIGYRMIKSLAERGHADGMCMYGIILNEGNIPGVDADPSQAAVWWRRCVDFHRHIKATYELGVANYTGEGVAENPSYALRLFIRAANLGHAGAAYMLGECLLDGVGTKRDRANALEWLVTAAELGHGLARKRVLFILNQEYEQLDAGRTDNEKGDESTKWVSESNVERVREVNIEKRYTIGGGSRNPSVLARRMTKVQESRDPSNKA